ncbi:MAG: deoxyribose-phosphate aldolase [Bacteroidetes bacterium]|nr:deoxyribose-phosphate aldolase [Bacteroidota bacterium]
MNLASYIDYTLLKQTTTYADIKKLCDEAIQHKFAAVCVPPFMVSYTKEQLKGTNVKLATVIGFPFGYEIANAKLAETKQAIDDGAEELDIVINVSALKSGDWSYLEKEMRPLVEIAHNHGKLVKVIIETGVLTDAEIVQCCSLYAGLGVDFLKTSTGYAEKGATVEAVKLMRKNLPAKIKIKASGGIRSYEFAKELIEAGAERIGTSRVLS